MPVQKRKTWCFFSTPALTLRWVNTKDLLFKVFYKIFLILKSVFWFAPQHLHDCIGVYNYELNSCVGSFCIPGSVLNIQTFEQKIYVLYIDSSPIKKYIFMDQVVFSPSSECQLIPFNDEYLRTEVRLSEFSLYEDKWTCKNLFEPGLSSGRSIFFFSCSS